MRISGPGTVVPFVVLIGSVIAAAVLLTPEPTTEDPVPDDVPPAAPTPAPEETPDLPPPPGSIGGLVTGGDPGPGIWIALIGLPQTHRVPLDELGGFEFPDVPAGRSVELWLGPDAAGREVIRLAADIVLGPGEHRRLELTAPDQAAIRGTVRNEKGQPVADVLVAVLEPDVDWRTAVPVAARTDEEGRFYIGFGGDAPAVPLRLVVDCVEQGYILEERIVTPTGRFGLEVTIELTKGLSIAGRAVGPGGTPLRDAEVHLVEMLSGDGHVRRPVEGRVRTDAEGRFTDDAFRPGAYRLTLQGKHDGKPYALVQDGVVAGDEEVEIRFKGYGAFEIQVADLTTRGPVGAEYVALEYIFGQTGIEEDYVSWSELEGATEAKFENLPEGHYRVRIETPGYQTLFSDILFIEAGKDLGLIRYSLTPL